MKKIIRHSVFIISFFSVWLSFSATALAEIKTVNERTIRTSNFQNPYPESKFSNRFAPDSGNSPGYIDPPPDVPDPNAETGAKTGNIGDAFAVIAVLCLIYALYVQEKRYKQQCTTVIIEK